jgi:hypothetical protein
MKARNIFLIDMTKSKLCSSHFELLQQINGFLLIVEPTAYEVRLKLFLKNMLT